MVTGLQKVFWKTKKSIKRHTLQSTLNYTHEREGTIWEPPPLLQPLTRFAFLSWVNLELKNTKLHQPNRMTNGETEWQWCESKRTYSGQAPDLLISQPGIIESWLYKHVHISRNSHWKLEGSFPQPFPSGPGVDLGNSDNKVNSRITAFSLQRRMGINALKLCNSDN